MSSKADELVAWRLLQAALRPELPADFSPKTPLSKRLLATIFPRRTNDGKETLIGRRIPVPVYGRTKEKQ
jgi:hypothetical protein